MAYRYLGATHFGKHTEVLQWGSLPNLPDCSGENQLLIEVKFVELNPVDLQKLQPQKSGQEIPNGPLIPGYGGSGTVVKSNSSDFSQGDSVVFLADPRRPGAYATHVVVESQCCCAIKTKSPNVSLAAAATLPLSGCTAYESLTKLRLDEGTKKLLIVGGAGGVGSWATLVAKAKYPHLEIICTASSGESGAHCIKNGASSVMNHDELLEKLEGGRSGSVDRILCLTEPKPDLWKALTEVVKPYGTICLVVAGPSVGNLDLGFCFFKSVTVTTETVFSSQRTNYAHSVPSTMMKDMLDLLESGKIGKAPLLAEDDWKDALKEGGLLDVVANGHTKGKLVLKIE